MRVKFYTNACCEIITPDCRILCDPWLVDGAFHGTWFHDPPIVTRPEDLTEYTHIYISHIHQDHYDEATLKRLPHKAPVLLCHQDEPFLQKAVERLGYPTIGVSPSHRWMIGGTRITMFGAFNNNPLAKDAEIANILDSSMLVESWGKKVMNFNDNMPDVEACRKIREEYGPIDLALMPYSGASDYPCSYGNLTLEERRKEAMDKRDRYLKLAVECLMELRPKAALPFAGQYRLGGGMEHKNEWLGVATPSEAAALFSLACESYIPREGMEIEVGDSGSLDELVMAARAKLWKRQEKYNWFKDYNLYLRVGRFQYAINLSHQRVGATNGICTPPYLSVSTTRAFLKKLLTREIHWNNAMIGAHLDMYRNPNAYEPDVYTLLSYFHV